jgi:hypothetical protein
MFRGRIARIAILGAAGLAACGGNDVVLPRDRVAAKILAARGDAQNGTVGAPLADSAVVRVTDVGNQPVSGQTVTFSVVSGGGSVSPATATTDANGLAGTRWTLGSVAGAQQIKAQATGNGAPGNLSVVLTATAGASAATAIALVSGDNQTGTAGSPLTDSLVVKATDVDGNPVAGVAVGWAVTGGGSVSAATTATGADGRAGVTRTLGPSAGAQTTVATAAGLSGSPVTFHATAAVGAAGQLVITRQPSSSATSGVALATQPQVQLEDANGNPVKQAGVAVQAQIANGPAGALVNATAATDPNGKATFAGLTITGQAGTYILSFFGASISGATCDPITLSAGAVSKLGFATAPSTTAQSGVPLVQQPEVQLEDAAGNPVSQAGVNITASVSAGASLSGTTTVATDGNGVASFTNLVVSGATGSYTLKFASGPINISASVTLGAGSVDGSKSSFTVTGGPITASNGSSTATAQIVARDASGNVVAGAAPSVDFCGGSTPAPATDGSGASSVAISCATAGNNQPVAVSLNGNPVTNPAGTHVLTIDPAASTTTLAASPAGSAPFGQQVTFTATVTGGVNTPTGMVTFKDNGATIGSDALDGSGKASFATTTLGGGPHSITAVYAGDNTYAGSSSSPLGYTISPLGTSTSVGSSNQNSVIGESVTFTATVTGLLATGMVQFQIDGGDFGAPVALGGGSATSAATTSLGLGNHSVVAIYSGDASHSGSTSSPLTQHVAQAATTTSIGSDVNPSTVGQSVTFTATVSATAPGGGTPSGNVQFKADGSDIGGLRALSGGTATLSTSALDAGTHQITATYQGTAAYAASTSSQLAQVVNRVATTTTVTSTGSPTNPGDDITVSFTVTPGAPTGVVTVTLDDGQGTTATCQHTLTSGDAGSGSCTATATTFASGSDVSVTASYAGDASFAPSTSTPVTHHIN